GPHGIGKTYWCRAQGWLVWGLMAVLRGLDQNDPSREGFLRDLKFFADGVIRAVDNDGSIHAFANDPKSLQETSGTAMIALSLHESIRRGWLEKGQYASVTQKMWDFCRKHVTDDGGFEKVYVEWALPAELYVE